jgi:alkanesulfonate monooxygenase SsuD/methylene tetrahydromethanopterin reductase-like flavin-dependent oxidoreductase (luciferase family)
MEIGLYTNAIDWSYPELREVWQAAERAGFGSAHLMDNVVGPDPRTDEAGVFEAYTTLAALAEATETIRIGPLATPNGRRHPSLLAKMTTMIDRIGDGRLILTMGAGDEPQHFVPWGMPFPDRRTRIAMLREELAVVKGLWTEPRFDFDGEHYRLSGAVNEPKPIQRPRPELWLGLCTGTRVMPRIVAEHCDGFNVYVGADEHASAVLAAVIAACEAAGRDPGSIVRSRHVLVTLADDEVDVEALYARQAAEIGRDVADLRAHYDFLFSHVAGPPEHCLAHIEHQRALGFNHLTVQFQGPDDPLGGRPESTLTAIRTFADQVAPKLAAATAP